MDGWIQNNWLEAAVAWWLLAEVSQTEQQFVCHPLLADSLEIKLKNGV